MQDSPLSITASVTGILTFTVAILAFIYIRYNTLKNSYTEMSTILRSVESSIEDTHMMQTTNLGDHLRKLLDELYQLEKDIMSEVLKVTQFSLFGPSEAVNEGVNLREVGLAALTAHGRRRRRLTDNIDFGFKAFDVFVQRYPQFIALLWAGVKFVLTLGQTPQLFRWYLVRDKVLKMTLQRETLRSRMLFYQMCLVHSRSASQEDAIHKLRGETNELRGRLVEMHSYVEEIAKGVNGDREHLASQKVLSG